MSKKAEQLIKEYLEREKPDEVDTDQSVRETAACLLWETGDPENQAAALKIWAEVGSDPDNIIEMKEQFAPPEQSVKK